MKNKFITIVSTGFLIDVDDMFIGLFFYCILSEPRF